MNPKILRFDFVLPSPAGKPLTLDVQLPEGAQNLPIVLFLHGFKGFKDWGHFNLLARHFAQHGFAFAKLNFSHNGTTPQQPTEFADLDAFAENNFSKELQDLKAVTDFLTSPVAGLPKNALNPALLFGLGHSRGGSVAILHAAEDARVKATATWAAVSDLEKRWTEAQLQAWKQTGVVYIANTRTNQQMPLRYQIVEDYYQNAGRFNVLKAAASLQNRLLLVHGEADESVPVACAHELKEANPEAALLLLPDTDHAFGGAHPFTLANLPKSALAPADATIRFFRKFSHGR